MVEEGRIARQEAGSLQCPRCGSNNTKFCYFNNYNTAQPRHFCRECHRYWTHGGALRNIPPPGTGNSRKNKRRVITGSSAAPGPTKVPRVHAEATGGDALIMTGPGLAHLGLQPPPPPPPPPPILFAEGMGFVDSGISLRPTLSLFNQGIVGALRGFQPFNSLMMPHPPPPPPQQQPLPLPLLHGFNMHQVLNVNAGEGSSATRGAADDGAGEGNNSQDGNVGDLFVNQFFTRFGDGEGGDQTKVDFNTGSGDANQTGAATGSTDAPPPPPPPASFI